MIDMTAAERLFDVSKELWKEYNEHPFVRGIADGSLDKEKFKYYMIQDYLYLIDYTKVFAVGAAKGRDLETMGLFAGYTHAILDGEMEIHRGYMKRLGISLEEAERAQPALDNLSYTSYMLRVALTHPFYGEWVSGYAAPEYHEQNQALIALTNRLTAGYSEVQLRHLEEIFVNCSRYEAAFWDMAWEMRR